MFKYSRIIFIFLTIILATSCSTKINKNLPYYPSQIEIEVNSATTREMDEETSNRSKLLHSYLVGRYSYLHEDFKTALSSFEQASTLLEKPSTEMHAVLAELYLKNEQLAKAQVEIEKAIKLDPTNVSFRLLYAGILESLEQFSEAEEQYLELIKQDKNLTEPYLLLAALSARSGKLNEGVQVLKKFVAIKPDSRIGYELLGRFYELLENYAQAERAFNLALKNGDITEALYISLTRIYLRQNKLEKAKIISDQMLAIEPDNKVAKRVLAELAISEGQIDQGLGRLREIQEKSTLDTDSDQLRMKIALLEIERKNYKAAERELLLVIARNSNHDSEARYYLASLYAGSGRNDEALGLISGISKSSQLYSKAKSFAAFLLRQDKKYNEAARELSELLEVEPKNKKARSYLSLILQDQGKLSEAEQVIAEGLNLDPNEPRFLYQQGVILKALNQDDKAIDLMERVIKLEPKNSDAINFIAYNLAEKGQDLVRAEKLALKSLSLRPNDPFYLDTLGWIYFKSGQFKRALKIFEQAVAVGKEDPVILEHYGDVLLVNKQKTKALEIYNRALNSAKRLDDQELIKKISDKIRNI